MSHKYAADISKASVELTPIDDRGYYVKPGLEVRYLESSIPIGYCHQAGLSAAFDDQDLLFPELPEGQEWGGPDGTQIIKKGHT